MRRLPWHRFFAGPPFIYLTFTAMLAFVTIVMVVRWYTGRLHPSLWLVWAVHAWVAWRFVWLGVKNMFRLPL